MRRAARTVVVSFPALVVVALAWLRLEQPLGSLGRALALLALALAAAVPHRRLLRGLGAVVATFAAARIHYRENRRGRADAFGSHELFGAIHGWSPKFQVPSP